MLAEILGNVALYVGPILAWLIVEFRGLKSATDGNPTYTETIRYAFKRWPWLKGVALAGWTWVFLHFFLPDLVPFA